MTQLNGPQLSVFVSEATDAAQTLDFTAYTYSYVGKSVGIVPSDAPLFNEFPGSNIVLYEKTWLTQMV
jgi:ABC-type transport system involved in Fe-S cluster assembly fused permease/ATPase subunit